MNSLEKTKKANEVAGLSDNRRAIDEALARLNPVRSAGTQLELHKPEAPTILEPGDRIEVERWCGRDDRRYVAIYKRGENGLYRFWTSVGIEAPDPSGVQRDGDEGITLDADIVDPDTEVEWCAWCKSTGKRVNGKGINSIRCGVCRGFICTYGLREDEGYFRCRPSCPGAGRVSNRFVSSQGTRGSSADPAPSGSELTVNPGTALVLKKDK